MLLERVKHAVSGGFTCLGPRQRAQRGTVYLGLTEHPVDHVRDDVGPPGEMPIQGGGAGIQPLSERSHRQRLSALLVDDLQCGRDDPIECDRGTAGGTSSLLLFCHATTPDQTAIPETL